MKPAKVKHLMKGKRKVYDLYKKDVYMARGTINELADISGLTIGTIYSYASSGYNKKWGIKPVNEYIGHEEIDTDRMIHLLRENDYSYDELSEVLEIPEEEVIRKLTKKEHFRTSEVEAIEDLFFLDDGELIKGE